MKLESFIKDVATLVLYGRGKVGEDTKAYLLEKGMAKVEGEEVVLLKTDGIIHLLRPLEWQVGKYLGLLAKAYPKSVEIGTIPVEIAAFMVLVGWATFKDGYIRATPLGIDTYVGGKDGSL